MAKRSWSLSGLNERTRTIGLLLLVVDTIFGAGLFAGAASSTLSPTEFIIAIGVLGVVLVASLVAITKIELVAARAGLGVSPSPLTPSTDLLDQLINGVLQTVCRATSLPQTPESAKLRVFIFRLEGGDQLVCRYYWSPNPTREEVGTTRFTVSEEVAREVAVVRSVLSRKITRTPVRPPSELVKSETQDAIKKDLTFVLAQPIFSDDGSVWGTVDFDTSTETGQALLSTDVSDAAMFQLSQHLQVIFSLQALRVPKAS